MRKIYVLVILLSLATVLVFADNWLNAQTEIQNSFNANSPGQNLQNQLLGSTNTSKSFLNLGSNVSLLDSNNTHDKGTYPLLVSISNSGTTVTTFTLPQNTLPGNVNWWKTSTTNNGQNFVSKISTSSNSNNISIYIYMPAGTSPGTYNEVITLATGNPGNDNNVWECFIDLTIVYKTQSYVATTTSYNASFSGITGNVLTNSYTKFGNGVLLAKLTVQSNTSTITVKVSTGVNGGNLASGINPSGLPKGMVLNYSGNYNNNVLTLPISDSNLYSGELDIFAFNSIASWAVPGQTTLQFQFTIIPKGSY